MKKFVILMTLLLLAASALICKSGNVKLLAREIVTNTRLIPVSVSIANGIEQGCGWEYPVVINIANKSEKRILRFRIEFSAMFTNRSTDIISESNNTPFTAFHGMKYGVVESDQIIAASGIVGEGKATGCFPVKFPPQLFQGSNRQFTLKVKNASFYMDGEDQARTATELDQNSKLFTTPMVPSHCGEYQQELTALTVGSCLAEPNHPGCLKIGKQLMANGEFTFAGKILMNVCQNEASPDWWMGCVCVTEVRLMQGYDQTACSSFTVLANSLLKCETPTPLYPERCKYKDYFNSRVKLHCGSGASSTKGT